MADYVLTETSEYELDQIWTYLYLNASERKADELVARIRDSLRILAQHPGMGLVCHDYGSGIRRHNVPDTSYYVLYRLATDRILVVRVMHGSRDPSRPLE